MKVKFKDGNSKDIECFTKADLQGADLFLADLRGKDLIWANLREANICEADLTWANLRWADLRGADLRGADLRGANLFRADLRETDLRGAIYSTFQLLQASWSGCSDLLTLEMMRWDAIDCGTEKMNEWAKGANYPFYDKEQNFYFRENRKLWSEGKPEMNHKELLIALCKEKGIVL